MSLDQNDFCLGHDSHSGIQRHIAVLTGAPCNILFILLAFSIVFQLSCSVSDKGDGQSDQIPHQERLTDQGPQRRTNTESRNKDLPLRRLQTSYYPPKLISGVATITDPNTGIRTVLASGDTHPEKQSSVSDKRDERRDLVPYQEQLADQGPQRRADTETRKKGQPLRRLQTSYYPPQLISGVATITDPNTGMKTVLASGILDPEEQLSVLDKVVEQSDLVPYYQEHLADQGPQRRDDVYGDDVDDPLGLLKPTPPPVAAGIAAVEDPNTGQKNVLASGILDPGQPPSPTGALSELTIVTDPNTGRKTVPLTIEHALARTLANSPEIRVVSFDPSIAKQDITRAAAAFDLTGFGRMNFEEEDTPPNSIYQSGESDIRTYETGIKQMGVTGAEWSLSYGLTRSWDDLVGRTFSTRYEPVLSFQLKQPLLRDAWEDVTLAGVNIAKLNYKIALLGFREKSEDIATQAISAYWRLVQARRDMEIQQELLDRTLDTLNKVEGRRGIDATNVQIKQTESFVKIREAALLQARKVIWDAQEVFIRLMADTQLNVLDEFEIIPVSKASVEAQELEPERVLELAMRKNPVIQQARMGVEIADINVRVAENQKMPRLDLIASTINQGLHKDEDTSHDRLKSGGYDSYAIGLSLEYPLGNRQREAEFLQRRLKRRQAVAALQNVADQVAIGAKEGLRRIKTNHAEIQVQKDAVEAAQIHLQTLKDTEPVREQLTPEFLLVKLQAQETLANTQRQENRAVIDFNISLVQLARILGTVFELHQIRSSMPTIPRSP